jgi:hypothetical protein
VQGLGDLTLDYNGNMVFECLIQPSWLSSVLGRSQTWLCKTRHQHNPMND